MEDMTIRVVRVGPIQTNCYIVYLPGRSDCLVIDPGDEPEKILRQTDGREIAAILFTHGHFDHIAGAEGILGPSTRVYIHREDAPMLHDPVLNAGIGLMEERVTGPEATDLFEEGDVIEAAGLSLKVLHTPGHTRGSSCFLAGDVLFSGDTVMAMGIGRTDLPGGSWKDMQESLEKLRPYAGKVQFLGGHG